MLKMSRENVAWYQSQVIVAVAREIKVPDYEFYWAPDLLDMIKNQNGPVFSKLQAFLEAHEKWWAFQEEHESELSDDGLAPENFTQNMGLVDERDRTRQELIDSLKP
ncbi:hypothetical protein KPA94_23120 [Burkholderia semiarida]|uniref:hypothetical protein n=1 Tax=Burkholderia semiarida TaxID=2843303 RepID=UPI0023DDFFCF|nr:hypothetical protein [Burkholderia semiarida]MDF3116326.1 hypothetical protein [Burkholderia semiarida]